MSKEMYAQAYSKVTVIIESENRKITHEFPIVTNVQLESHETTPDLDYRDHIRTMPIIDAISVEFRPLPDRDGHLYITKDEAI